MTPEQTTFDKQTHCAHCGKNLRLIKKRFITVKAGAAYCSQSCNDLSALAQEASKDGKRSKRRFA